VRRLLVAGGAVLTGLLTAAAFEPLAWKDVAWVCLLPLLGALYAAERKDAFRLGMISGSVFWLVSIVWLTRVTVAGWIVLSLYCALYFACFAVVCSWWMKRCGVTGLAGNMGLMAVGTLSWTALEFARSNVASGFPWNPLGAAQAPSLAVVQIASWGGVYAVSALVVWVNLSFATTILQHVERRGGWSRRPHLELMAGLVALAGAFSWGVHAVGRLQPGGESLRVALIQPNIPQDEKWDQAKIDLIYSRLQGLTLSALGYGKPDLVVWPETALPDDVRQSPASYDLVYSLATHGVPMLVGTMDTAWTDDLGPLYFNSSFLFDGAGMIVAVYEKQHLVPFGEYVPFRKVLPFLKAMTPIQESFTPGRTSTVFRIEKPAAAFASLICFEDTVAALARRAVRNGARLLINQTNDAWFDPSAASRQHMAQCVFRCIENRVPAIRVANTGVTCHIDEAGRVIAVLQGEHGDTRVSAFKMADVRPAPADRPPTFYTRHGDAFAWLACAVALPALLGAFGLRLRGAKDSAGDGLTHARPTGRDL